MQSRDVPTRGPRDFFLSKRVEDIRSRLYYQILFIWYRRYLESADLSNVNVNSDSTMMLPDVKCQKHMYRYHIPSMPAFNIFLSWTSFKFFRKVRYCSSFLFKKFATLHFYIVTLYPVNSIIYVLHYAFIKIGFFSISACIENKIHNSFVDLCLIISCSSSINHISRVIFQYIDFISPFKVNNLTLFLIQ